MKLLKLAVERLHDQVEQLSLDLKSVKEELKELKEGKLVAPAAEVQSNVKDEYINTKEVQQLLGVCYNTLRRVVEEGHLKPVRINQRRVRYNKADVIRYLERGS